MSDETIINHFNGQDPIDQIIYGENLRIQAIHFHPDLDLWLMVLNNGKILKRTISTIPSFKGVTKSQLENVEFVGNGTGLHWPELDMDLSLRGFLQEEILRMSQSMVA